MKYNKFIIYHYKGITTKIEIDVTKQSIIPIIGVNEAGKTSILEGILAFDKFNDQTNNGKHLIGIENYYDPTDDAPSVVGSEISINQNELRTEIDSLLEKEDGKFLNEIAGKFEKELLSIISKNIANNTLLIKRNISSKKYSSDIGLSPDIDHVFCEQILSELPYILYFDDFRDEIPQFLEVPNKTSSQKSIWVPYFKELFLQTNAAYNFEELRDKASNIRDAILREAQNLIQEKLVQHWKNFSLQESQPLRIELKYHPEHKIEIKIVEELLINGMKRDRFFDIKDRSKGFYWYFNFIMKLEFNPKKRHREDMETIYLLDEPGSYLHASAQKKLCDRLKSISSRNKVIFCTHSPYLLDPVQIPIGNIKIVRKENESTIKLDNIYSTPLPRRNAAFQPILHALEMPFLFLDYSKNNIILTEGIYDYYIWEIMKEAKNLAFFPCDGANSLKHHISYMIFLGKKYSAIWDLDNEGRTAFVSAQKSFGIRESEKWLFYQRGKSKKVILQDLISGDDISMLKKSLELPSNTNFKSVVLAWFFSVKRHQLKNALSTTTVSNFSNVERQIKDKLRNQK